MTRHADSPFPLRGAHQATACFSCHKSQTARIAAKGVDTKTIYAKAVDLAPAHTACTDCHRDPHLGQTKNTKTAAGQTGCTACHTENSWRQPEFDHGTTKYPLENRHATVACTACHKPTRNAGQVELAFQGAASNCAGCHDDIHRGEFANRKTADGQAIDCAACHVTLDWFAEKFNHETDSRFPLSGGHEKVACQTCHIPRPEDNQRLVHFKPLPIDCRSCHGNAPTESQESKEGKS
ncbi:hypothetical protein DRQ50_13835 [bacterium]|nr:MAG: hypothetical protein DRQ50_13835 [bacterium]